MVNNERVLIHGINYLGSRVSVDVVCLHLQSLYDLMSIAMDSATDASLSSSSNSTLSLYVQPMQ